MSLAEAIASLRDWTPSAPPYEIRGKPAKDLPGKAALPSPSEKSTDSHDRTGGTRGLALKDAVWPDPEDLAEFIAERAAIMEYDGGLERTEARKAAGRRAAVKYRLGELYGDPLQLGGGYAIGGDGDRVEEVLHDLRKRYGSRLITAEAEGTGSG